MESRTLQAEKVWAFPPPPPYAGPVSSSVAEGCAQCGKYRVAYGIGWLYQYRAGGMLLDGLYCSEGCCRESQWGER